MSSSQLSARVPSSWDNVFTTYRLNFYAPGQNQTPEEYLGEFSGTTRHEHGLETGGSAEPVAETVARFMESSSGFTNGPSSIHQSEVVTSFCRHAQSDVLWVEGGEGRVNRPVALVYGWENKPPSRPRQHSSPAVPLTHLQLLNKLCEKRFVDQNRYSDEGPQSSESAIEMDADRRLIYINNLDPLVISVLAKTTSCLETPVIQRTVLKYLTAQTSFEVHIAPRGFRTFSLELNVSFFCLRRSTNPSRSDQRLRWDGNGHLRATLPSPRNPTSDVLSSAENLYNIYETQISIAVTGVDHWRWTAWGFVDTWFETHDAVSEYYEGEGSGAQPDPLAAGQIDTNPPERYPREYFLKVFEIRIGIVAKEWNYILHVLQQEVQEVGANPLFTSPQRSFENKEGRSKIRKLATWNGDMTKLIGTLLKSLSRTLVAWDVFQKTDIGYFLYDDNDESPSQYSRPDQLLPSLRIIEKTFLNLHITLEELEQVKLSLDELGRGLARGERTYSTFVQQRTGEHIKLLTWVTIGWSPVMIATGMCSTQTGIFPFQNNIWDFFASVLVIGGLVGLTIVVLLSRHSNLIEWKIPSTITSPDNLTEKPEPVETHNGAAKRKSPSFPPRVFTRQWTEGSKFSGKTLVSRGLELSGLRASVPTDRLPSNTIRRSGRRNDTLSMAESQMSV